MSGHTRELIQICERLPEAKRVEVADFARFLLAREGDAPGREGDARWERIIDDPRPRPRLEAFLKESALEAAEPLDPDRL